MSHLITSNSDLNTPLKWVTEVHTSRSAAGFSASESRLRNSAVSNLLAKSKNYNFRGFISMKIQILEKKTKPTKTGRMVLWLSF